MHGKGGRRGQLEAAAPGNGGEDFGAKASEPAAMAGDRGQRSGDRDGNGVSCAPCHVSRLTAGLGGG